MQWQVFQRAFSETTTMVLIGDPKQAIYAFRGGDIVTYLQAAETATTDPDARHQLARATAPARRAPRACCRAPQLGDERIVVHPVEAHHDAVAAGRGAARAVPAAGRAARPSSARAARPGRRSRCGATTSSPTSPTTSSGCSSLRRRPSTGARLRARRRRRPRRPPQRARGCPAGAGRASACRRWSTPAARSSTPRPPTSGSTLLEALEQPHRADRVRAAALTSFFGHTAAALDAGGDDLTDELDRPGPHAGRRLHPARRRGGGRGGRRSTGSPRGSWRAPAASAPLTDLRHIGESLHRVATEERLGLVGLLAWLREQVADEKLEVASERTRRLDSDAEAVQLVTIHGSKGLQYPVVYLPTLWNRYTGRDADRPALPRRRRPALPRRRRAEHRPPRGRPPPLARGRRRVAPPALRRDDARPVAGRRVVRRRRPQHPGLAAPPDALRPPTGHGAGARQPGAASTRTG